MNRDKWFLFSVADDGRSGINIEPDGKGGIKIWSDGVCAVVSKKGFIVRESSTGMEIMVDLKRNKLV